MGHTIPENEEETANFQKTIASSGLRNSNWITNPHRHALAFGNLNALHNVSEAPLEGFLSPEEILAMQFTYLRELSEDAGHPVEHLVLIVPPYFTDIQK